MCANLPKGHFPLSFLVIGTLSVNLSPSTDAQTKDRPNQASATEPTDCLNCRDETTPSPPVGHSNQSPADTIADSVNLVSTSRACPSHCYAPDALIVRSKTPDTTPKLIHQPPLHSDCLQPGNSPAIPEAGTVSANDNCNSMTASADRSVHLLEAGQPELVDKSVESGRTPELDTISPLMQSLVPSGLGSIVTNSVAVSGSASGLSSGSSSAIGNSNNSYRSWSLQPPDCTTQSRRLNEGRAERVVRRNSARRRAGERCEECREEEGRQGRGEEQATVHKPAEAEKEADCGARLDVVASRTDCRGGSGGKMKAIRASRKKGIHSNNLFDAFAVSNPDFYGSCMFCSKFAGFPSLA
ncbi:unnamed protein product [Protopolystoma xenopodis]|uniref:Uncharacterized protein n=1 Tax=Protopolystoma xenopodis TaxID=117903 RepID=A0A448XBF7_9PLAT|nr:unnamed protein product [Protopolystoma xenopodis]